MLGGRGGRGECLIWGLGGGLYRKRKQEGIGLRPHGLVWTHDPLGISWSWGTYRLGIGAAARTANGEPCIEHHRCLDGRRRGYRLIYTADMEVHDITSFWSLE